MRPSLPGEERAAGPTPDESGSPTPPRRTRGASEGSATQRAQPPGTRPSPAGPDAPESSRPAPESRPASGPQSSSGSETTPGAETTPAERTSPAGPRRARSADAPWHHARPAFDDPEPQPDSEPQPEPAGQPEPERDPEARPEPPGPATDDAPHDSGDHGDNGTPADVTPRDTPDPEPPTGGSQ
ncbi:hypothetical protein [Streptomyces scabiei]|uniref:Uncharacterized protein n=1 Tax=Streptomyces scabiei TaxID=1930 RepID=A0A100JK83_STRSC|nr:hypothetical protein [Streptomyces scabiei]GAQ61082.1 hypothetical protein SsS58_01429 [Streptomyces scabiei]